MPQVKLMSRKSMPVLLVAAVLAATVGFVFHRWSFSQYPRLSHGGVADPGVHLAVPEKSSVAGLSGSANAAGDEALQAAGTWKMAKIPPVEPSLRYAQRRVEAIYGDVLKSLRLSPDESQRIRELLAERWLTTKDARAVVDENRVLAADQRMAVVHEAEAAVDEQIRAAVGDATFQKVQAMLLASPFHEQVRTIYSSDMSFAGSPLTSDQAAALGGLLYDTYGRDSRQKEGLRAEWADPSIPLSVLDVEALKRAAAFLNRKQLEVLQADLELSTQSLRQSWPPKRGTK
jgi:hypothetical protein